MNATANILLVDDEPRNLDVLESILSSPGYRLVRAGTADEALLALVDGEFAVIVLDIRMPGMSGLELANLVKQRKKTQHIPIIFLTAYYQEDKYVLEGYGMGAVDYLTKPVNATILRSKVAVFADLFRSTRALAQANQALELEVTQRKQAEDALRRANAELEGRVLQRTADLSKANLDLQETERHYRELVQALPVAIYTTDAEGRMALWNQAAVALWGREPEAGRTMWCGSHLIYRPDGTPLPHEQCPMAVTLREGRARRGQEILIERPDGTRRHALSYPELIRDGTGHVLGAVEMLVDMTDKKRTEEALRQSEERLRLAMDTALDAIVTIDGDGRITGWNPQAENTFGWTHAEVTGRRLSETIIPPRHREAHERGLRQYLETGLGPILRNRIEMAALHRSGREFPVELSITPFIAENKVYFTAFLRDITERRKAEAALRESEERLRRVVDFDEAVMANMGEGLYTVDTQGLVTSMNPAAEELFGWSFEELRGRKMHDITHHHRADGTPFPAEECAGLQVLKNGRTLADHEDCFIRKDGTFFDVIYSSAPLRSADGIAGVVVVFRDVTDRKRAEMALRESEARLSAASRAKDNFLAALSHELRTPLNPVLLLASDAAEDADLPTAIRANFASIRHNVELEARLIDDLLDLTRITSGKLGLRLAEVDVHAVLQSALDTVRADIDRKRIVLTLALNAAQHQVIGDQVRLQQIFWNLLKNAVKFTPEAGGITVETTVHADGGTLLIKVTDTGIGMTTEEIERVFQAFSQGDHASNIGPHRFGGMGLGLAISRMLVELHSGAIHAASGGRDQGSSFVVKLPLGREGSPEGNPGPPAPARPAQAMHRAEPALRRILLVEDHEPTRTALAQLLRRRQYEVSTAASVAEALVRAEEGDIDLLISDIGLPDGNGFDLMSKLRDQHRLKGIALTGYGMEQDIARSQAAGFVGHLTKPVRVQSLEEALVAVAGVGGAKPPVPPET